MAAVATTAATMDRGMKSEEVNGIAAAFARDRFQDSYIPSL